MNAEIWREGFLSTLHQFASEEYQERVWRHGKGPEVSSFDEAYNDFFDLYYNTKDLPAYCRALHWNVQKENAIKDFASLLEALGDSVPETTSVSDVFDNPLWPSVPMRASELRTTLLR